MIKDDENMPEWVQSKITLAQDYITTVRDYLQSKEELGEAFKLNQDAKLTAIAKVRKEKMKSFRQHIGKK
jgi:serine protease inhibitor